jgi:hypothetical protein
VLADGDRRLAVGRGRERLVVVDVADGRRIRSADDYHRLDRRQRRPADRQDAPLVLGQRLERDHRPAARAQSKVRRVLLEDGVTMRRPASIALTDRRAGVRPPSCDELDAGSVAQGLTAAELADRSGSRRRECRHCYAAG